MYFKQILEILMLFIWLMFRFESIRQKVRYPSYILHSYTNKLRFCRPSTVFQHFECDNYDFWDFFSKSKAFFLILIYSLELCVMFMWLNSNKYNNILIKLQTKTILFLKKMNVYRLRNIQFVSP